MYRLHHEGKVSTSLRDLHTRGPQARGNVNHVETDSRVM